MIRSVNELFQSIQKRPSHIETTCAISYLEIYNEEVRDLFQKKGTTKLRLMENGKGVSIPKLSTRVPHRASEVLKWLDEGNLKRSVCATDRNATSSRSHAVLQIRVSTRDVLKRTEMHSKLSLIDLAGSERAQKIKRASHLEREGSNINRSLLALGGCITALVKKNKHVPFRDSKLTLLLKDSLGGNCRSVMLAAISHSKQSFEDTYNTLKYADCFKKIKVKMTINRRKLNMNEKDYRKALQKKDSLILSLQKQIVKLKNGKNTNHFETAGNEEVKLFEIQVRKQLKEKEKLETQLLHDKLQRFRRDKLQEQFHFRSPNKLTSQLVSINKKIETTKISFLNSNVSVRSKELMAVKTESFQQQTKIKRLENQITGLQNQMKDSLESVLLEFQDMHESILQLSESGPRQDFATHLKLLLLKSEKTVSKYEKQKSTSSLSPFPVTPKTVVARKRIAGSVDSRFERPAKKRKLNAIPKNPKPLVTSTPNHSVFTAPLSPHPKSSDPAPRPLFVGSNLPTICFKPNRIQKVRNRSTRKSRKRKKWSFANDSPRASPVQRKRKRKLTRKNPRKKSKTPARKKVFRMPSPPTPPGYSIRSPSPTLAENFVLPQLDELPTHKELNKSDPSNGDSDPQTMREISITWKKKRGKLQFQHTLNNPTEESVLLSQPIILPSRENHENAIQIQAKRNISSQESYFSPGAFFPQPAESFNEKSLSWICKSTKAAIGCTKSGLYRCT